MIAALLRPRTRTSLSPVSRARAATALHETDDRATRRAMIASFLTLLSLSGCGGGGGGGYDGYGYGDGSGPPITFQDNVATNAEPGDVVSLEFTTPDGETAALESLAKGKRLVLVVTRGLTGAVCPYCSTQVSQLIANHAKFEKKNAEIVVVFPIQEMKDRARYDEFLKKTRERLGDPKTTVPFPVLFDVDLKAVDRLGIRKDLSKPATYILDAGRQVRFAYVGERLADRPSIKALLEQLDAIPSEGG